MSSALLSILPASSASFSFTLPSGEYSPVAIASDSSLIFAAGVFMPCISVVMNLCLSVNILFMVRLSVSSLSESIFMPHMYLPKYLLSDWGSFSMLPEASLTGYSDSLLKGLTIRCIIHTPPMSMMSAQPPMTAYMSFRISPYTCPLKRYSATPMSLLSSYSPHIILSPLISASVSGAYPESKSITFTS